eukprot:COSAG04_NODE_4264_length_2199_cov_1.375714_1_plen_125_part_10
MMMRPEGLIAPALLHPRSLCFRPSASSGATCQQTCQSWGLGFLLPVPAAAASPAARRRVRRGALAVLALHRGGGGGTDDSFATLWLRLGLQQNLVLSSFGFDSDSTRAGAEGRKKPVREANEALG